MTAAHTFAGDVAALRPNLMRFARKLTRSEDAAEDLAQDTILRAFDKRELFEPGTDLRAWLFTLLHNLWVNGVRASVSAGVHVELTEANGPSASGAAERAVLVDQCRRVMARIPAGMRQVIEAVAVDGCSYQRAAERLCIPTGTVRSRYSRGRRLVARKMAAAVKRHA
jgi:RNA polymerase sigma-70 factor (ECF subfamily)